MKKLLYFSTNTQGGLAEYAHEQANALALLGVEVIMLAPGDFAENRDRKYRKIPLINSSRIYRNIVLRKLHHTYILLQQYWYLAHIIEEKKIGYVIMGTFSEYFAPLWSGRLRRLARNGVKFGTVVHDPVRDFMFGPAWWHHYSIYCAYSFLTEAFVHEKIILTTIHAKMELRTTVIPHGPYLLPKTDKSRTSIRECLNIRDGALLFLSFGHIRDSKNLDLMILAMKDNPDVFLVVAGKEQSSRHKPITFYYELAERAGVQDRCRWIHGYVSQEHASELFEACDMILVTYNSEFRSASGVLNTAIKFRKPCLASSGQGNLKTVVERYQLGLFVKPDDVKALAEGLNRALKFRFCPQWEAYESENSWDINAKILVEAMSLPPLTKVLIFSPSARGGIAEHTYYQARALEKAGAKVICLVSPSFLAGRKTDFEKLPCLPDPVEGPTGLVKKLRMAWRIIWSGYVLAWQIIKLRPNFVLLDSYVEYLAPLWIDPHILLSRIFGVCYAANLHDPVRSYEIGAKWWHRLSVWLAYQPLDFVLVHDQLPEPSPIPRNVLSVEVPVGVYDISGIPLHVEKIREDLGVKVGQRVFLSFGYVRDGKNIDLAVQSLSKVPNAFLVVAGSVASSNDRPFSYYRELASQLGVSDRCYFSEGFVADEELGKYFAATDFVLLTYSSSFYSQSGVLNIAARARKPVLASAAPSPLIKLVKLFSLGLAITPDCLESVVEGMRSLIANPPQPCWEDYEAAASWDLNAKKLLETAKCVANTPSCETKSPAS